MLQLIEALNQSQKRPSTWRAVTALFAFAGIAIAGIAIAGIAGFAIAKQRVKMIALGSQLSLSGVQLLVRVSKGSFGFWV